MRRTLRRVLMTVVLAFFAAAPASAALSLRIVGNHFVDGKGHALRLLGVNRSGAEYACIQGWGFWDGPVDAASIAAMRSWGINSVRVPLNEDCRSRGRSAPTTRSCWISTTSRTTCRGSAGARAAARSPGCSSW